MRLPDRQSFVLVFLKGSKRAVAGLVIASSMGGFVEAALLLTIVKAALTISSGGQYAEIAIGPIDVGHVSVGTLALAGGALLMLKVVAEALSARLTAGLSTRAMSGLRTEGFAAYLHAAWSIQAGEPDGRMQELMTTNVQRGGTVVLVVAAAIASTLNLAALLASAVVVNALAAVTILVVMIVLFFGLRPLTLLSRRAATEMLRTNADYASATAEIVNVMQEVRTFAVEQAVTERMDERVNLAARPYQRWQYLTRFVPTLYQTAAFGLVLLGLWSVQASGSGEFASLGAVVLILVRAVAYGQALQTAYQMYHAVMPDLEAVLESTEQYKSSRPLSGSQVAVRVDRLEFREVGFEYTPGQPVLRNVSFEVSSGEMVGIVGPSGAGKSTFVQLLLRLRQPTDGSIRVGGTPVDQIDLAAWFAKVAFVPQECRLVDGTIADNVRFFRDVDHNDVIRAIEQGALADEVSALREREETLVGPRGTSLSGGQRQRLALARALVGDPQLLILDEPTSALDGRSELLVQSALERLRGGRIVFIVAHRLSTLAFCDRIMVFDKGRLADFDTGPELEKRQGYFREMLELATRRR